MTRKLDDYRSAKVEALMLHLEPDANIVAGATPEGVSFSMQTDDDGHQEIYLSGNGKMRVGDGVARAFFREFGLVQGVEIDRDKFHLPYMRGWVLP